MKILIHLLRTSKHVPLNQQKPLGLNSLFTLSKYNELNKPYWFTSNRTIHSHSCLRCTNNDEKPKAEEVYYGTLTPRVFGVKVFSLGTSLGGLCLQPIIYKQLEATGSLGLVIGLATVAGFFTFVTPLLLHLITKKYVTHIYYMPADNSYTASLITFFLRKKRISFKPEDITVPDIPGMFTSFLIKGRPVLVDPKLFSESAHYAKIMGYDKPIDYKLGKIADKVSEFSKKDTS